MKFICSSVILSIFIPPQFNQTTNSITNTASVSPHIMPTKKVVSFLILFLQDYFNYVDVFAFLFAKLKRWACTEESFISPLDNIIPLSPICPTSYFVHPRFICLNSLNYIFLWFVHFIYLLSMIKLKVLLLLL